MAGRADKRLFTFSFEPALLREIGKTIAVIGVIVLCSELVFRCLVPNMSKNSRTIEAWDERAARIEAAQSDLSLLILGNSMSGEAIDAQRLSQQLASLGAPSLVEHQPADSTAVRDWYYELKNMYVDQGAIPDWLVLPVGDARALTRVNERTEDLLFSFLRWDDLGQFFEIDDIDGFEERASVIAGWSSALYCFRGRFQKRILTMLVPEYEELRTAMRSTGSPGEAVTTTAWAEELNELTSAHGIRVVVIALPTEALGGVLRPVDRAVARYFGWTVLEPGRNESWSPEDVPDGLHLSGPARARFTDLLAQPLAQLLIGDPRVR